MPNFKACFLKNNITVLSWYNFIIMVLFSIDINLVFYNFLLFAILWESWNL